MKATYWLYLLSVVLGACTGPKSDDTATRDSEVDSDTPTDSDTDADSDSDSDSDTDADTDTDSDTDVDTGPTDADGDGWAPVEGDCDDADPTAHPEASESCDEVDQDCDGALDDARGMRSALTEDDAGARLNDVAGSWLGVGDLDGDGAPDVATGQWYLGGAFVFGGIAEGSSLGPSDATVTVISTDERFAEVGGIPGDMTGDGQDDLVLGGDMGVVVLAGPLSGAVDAATALASIDGGRVFVGTETDGDGSTDLVVGDPYWSDLADDAGAVHVLAGPVGFGALDRTRDAMASVVTDEADAHLGGSVTAAGDVDGDGLADLWIGEQGSQRSGFYRGGALLILGPVSGMIDANDADTLVVPASNDADQLGAAVSAGGDLDGDGYSDLTLGAGGSAYVFAGPLASGSLTEADATATAAASGSCGYSIDATVDLDSDGRDELTVSCPTWSRTSLSYLWYGPVAGTVSYETADVTFEGYGYYSQFGMPTLGLGDIDGDGVDDIAFSDGDTGGGGNAVFVFFGGCP